MKGTICTSWLIFFLLVCVAVASEFNENQISIPTVFKEIESNEIKSKSEKLTSVLSATAMNVLESGISAVGSSVCQIDLKILMNGLRTRIPWAISSKLFCLIVTSTLNCKYVFFY